MTVTLSPLETLTSSTTLPLSFSMLSDDNLDANLSRVLDVEVDVASTPLTSASRPFFVDLLGLGLAFLKLSTFLPISSPMRFLVSKSSEGSPGTVCTDEADDRRIRGICDDRDSTFSLRDRRLLTLFDFVIRRGATFAGVETERLSRVVPANKEVWELIAEWNCALA